MRLAELETYLIRHTERFLTWRKRRKLKRKARQKQKNQIIDWIQALLWAAVVVLIINQYLIQAYEVPSGSMEDTILGGDRLFVNKVVYGPELVPGHGKLPGFERAERGDIVVFVNPEFHPVSPVAELFNRLVYMLTFTLVNLDRNPDGSIAKHFLVKRLIAQPGERIRMRDGRVEIREVAANAWTSEEELKNGHVPLDYTLQKKFYPYEKYPVVRDYILQQVYLQGGAAPESPAPGIDAGYVAALCSPRVAAALSPERPEEFEYYYFQIVLEDFGKYNHLKDTWTFDKIRTEYRKLILSLIGPRDADPYKLSDDEVALGYQKAILAYNGAPRSRIDAMSREETAAAFQSAAVKYVYTHSLKPDSELYTDLYFEDYWTFRARCSLKPDDAAARNWFERRALGWYIRPDQFFPMGDNRDNSKDARFFNAVDDSKLLGKSLFRFWPLNRLGAVN